MTAAPALLPSLHALVEKWRNKRDPNNELEEWYGAACLDCADELEALLSRAATTQATRDWMEDAAHENGNYFCRCVHCGNKFVGHKRRVCCKLCAVVQPVAPVVADGEQTVACGRVMVGCGTDFYDPVCTLSRGHTGICLSTAAEANYHTDIDVNNSQPSNKQNSTERKMKVTDEMVQRFLGWKLPETFAPDCYISFDREGVKRMGNGTHWPVGTNLLNDPEARAMLEHVLAVAPLMVPDGWQVVPKEMTDWMRKFTGVSQSAWADLLAAAPNPPHPAQPQEREPRAEEWLIAFNEQINRMGGQGLYAAEFTRIEARARELARK